MQISVHFLKQKCRFIDSKFGFVLFASNMFGCWYLFAVILLHAIDALKEVPKSQSDKGEWNCYLSLSLGDFFPLPCSQKHSSSSPSVLLFSFCLGSHAGSRRCASTPSVLESQTDGCGGGSEGLARTLITKVEDFPLIWHQHFSTVIST